MLALHDFRCKKCNMIFEQLVSHTLQTVDCTECGGKAVKTFERWHRGGQLHSFPEGPWHGLPEVNGHPPEIRTKRQLREALKRKAKDDFTESYATYDDGYGGY